MQKLIISAALVCLTAVVATAGGYQVSVHGQKQIGMGLIGTSLHMDASAAFFNPGGLAMMPQRLSILGGASGIFASTAFQQQQPSLYQAKTDNPTSTPFYFYAAARITDRLVGGIAVNTPYGSNLAWEEGWAGRFLIQDISMRAITLQPTLSYRLTDQVSVGGGLVYVMGSVDMNRALPVQGPDGEGYVNISGNTTSFGFNAGIQYTGSGLGIGLSYRSRIDMEMEDADALFTVPASLAALFPAVNKAATSLPLPANLDMGVSYQLSPALMLGMSLNYVFWEAYDQLSFDFEQNTPSLPDSENPREYSNTLIVRVGGEYQVNGRLTLRAGAYYDPSPANENYFSPETPSLNNLAFSAGFSFHPLPNLSIDTSLLMIAGLEKDMMYAPENFGGTYRSSILVPGVGVSYGF